MSKVDHSSQSLLVQSEETKTSVGAALLNPSLRGSRPLEKQVRKTRKRGKLGMSPFRYRILVVDDDESIATMAKAILESQGYEVLCAVDGFDGLTALKQSPPDVIISDLQMPNMSGFEFLSIVRKRFPNIPTIAMSGAFSGKDVPENALADAFFEKGQYSRKELFQKIIALLKEVPARPSISRRVKPAVWIPISDANYIAVTCPSCLRTFPVPAPLPVGAHTVECDACASAVSFHITDEFRTRCMN
jgi:CheY-like chemotaxis protein